MATENDFILKLFESLENSIREFKSETNEKLSIQQNSIEELKQRTLIPKDANRFDLVMSVLRENPNKAFITLWITICFLIIAGKYDVLNIILTTIIGTPLVGG